MASNYASALRAIRGVVDLIKPPNMMSVSESAASFLKVPKGATSESFSLDLTPYMREPMDMLGRRDVRTVVFAGPAQSGKTFSLIFGGLTHSILTDPSDVMVVQMTKDEARTLSRQRLSRIIEVSPAINNMLGRSSEDNVFDKRFKNGIFVNVGWPTVSQLSSKPIQRMFLTDYDRMPENINGEGSAFVLASQRPKTYGSRGKVLVESSPGRDIIDPDYSVRFHEAPPTSGILGLYNLGDKRRLYWTCPHCAEYFLADWENLSWDKDEVDILKAGESAHMVCSSCSAKIASSKKYDLNAKSAWRTEYDVFGIGSPKMDIASYWMHGTAAAFQPWSKLVVNYLTALSDFEFTGSQESLRATVNADQGRPYLFIKNSSGALDYTKLQQRSEGYAEQRKVPAKARFLTTAIDSQKNRFVVQVQAWGENAESWIVDRFNITKSDRIGEDGNRVNVEPFSYPEDWSALDRLLDDEYEVVGSEAKVKSSFVVCDSGGAGDATANAYVYALRLKRLKKLERFALLKGGSSNKSARIAKGKAGDEKIKVPLWIINTTMLKDEVFDALGRSDAGANYIHLPDWMGEWFFKELTAEVKLPNGRYEKKRKGDNNEALDLCGYNRIAYSLLGGDKINWDSPPPWCARELGEVLPENVKVTATGNEKYLEFIRARGKRLNEQ